MAVINGDADNNIIDGTNDDDVLSGFGGDDLISGFGGMDNILGGDGDDTLRPGGGNDVLDGGAGNDVYDVSFEPFSYLINLTNGFGTADIGLGHGAGGAPFDTFSNIESVFGSALTDFVAGSAADNLLFGNGGDDAMGGGLGNDQLDGGAGDDNLSGEDGDDFLRGGAGDDILNGGLGFDVASFSDRFNGFMFTVAAMGQTAVSGGENDTLMGVDSIIGTFANDVLNVANDFVGDDGSGFFQFEGGGGDDVVTGNGETRIVYSGASSGVRVDFNAGAANAIGNGDSGSDTFTGVNSVNGSRFDDILLGTDSPDFESFRGQAGNDFIDGGGGDADRADYRNSPAGVDVDLSRNLGFDGFGTVDFLFNIELVRGSNHDDVMTGDGRNNTFRGRGGDDTFIGGGGFADTADYRSDTPVGISATMTGAFASVVGLSGTSVGMDTLIEIERVFGTPMDDVYLADMSFDNGQTVLEDVNASQFNIFRGGDGDDDITGNGVTRIEYNDATDAVLVDLSMGSATSLGSDAGIGVDAFSNVFSVRGSAFGDVLIGSTNMPALGFEDFIGEAGDDLIDGGGGQNRANYFTSPSAVLVDLLNGTADDGFGGTDTLVDIQGARGSNHDDILIGDGEANVFEGLVGDDVIDGRGGLDRVEYDLLNAKVSVNLLAGEAEKGVNGFESLVSIEQVLGTPFNDSIVGDGGMNLLGGEAGHDRIVGLAGADTLGGFSGNDILYGNSGDDILQGDAGRDRLIGGFGVDTMFGGEGDDTYFVDDVGDMVMENFDEGIDTVIIQQGINGFFNARPNVEIYILDFQPGETAFLNGLDGFGDTLVGGDSDDTLTGLSGDDILLGGNGDDMLDGGNGVDLLKAGAGADVIDAGDGDDRAGGGAGDDRISGGDGFDRLNGQSGDDVLIGGAGPDRLIGGFGDDMLFAYQGPAGMPDVGDGSQDRFLISANSGIDMIYGFVDGEDMFDLRGVNQQTGLFPSFNALQPFISEVNGDAVIQFSVNDMATVVGVSAAALDATDFIF